MKFKAYPGGAPLRSAGIMGQLRRTGTSVSEKPELAIPGSLEHICPDAPSIVEPESVERFCRIWAEVGRAILARRSR